MSYDKKIADQMVENLCVQIESLHDSCDKYEYELDRKDKIIESLERQIEMLEEIIHDK